MLDLLSRRKNFYPPGIIRVSGTPQTPTRPATVPPQQLPMYRFLHSRSQTQTMAGGPAAIRHWLLLAMTALATGPLVGCSSAISMRESLRTSIEQAAAMTQLTSLADLSSDPHAAEAGPIETASYEADQITGPTYAELADSLADDAEAVAAAIESAIDNLAEADSLDTASKAALMETLEMTPQADWPVVIEEFTGTLTALRASTKPGNEPVPSTEDLTEPGATAHPTAAVEQAQSGIDPTALLVTSETIAPESDLSSENTSPQGMPPEPSEDTAATDQATKANDDAPANEQEAAAVLTTAVHKASSDTNASQTATAAPDQPVEPVAAESLSSHSEPASSSATQVNPSPEDRPSPAPSQQLAIANPSIVREVRGWGMVEPFAPEDLQPGAEVIVYFELTGLTGTPSATGIITQVATSLRLEDSQGNELHKWSFPPITETCATQRHDYFARYLVDLPADLSPGSHQFVLTVTDQQAKMTAEQIVPLAIAPRQPEATLAQAQD